MSRLSTVLTKMATLIMGHDETIGDTPITTTAQTLTGAVNELDSDISSLNSNMGSMKFTGVTKTLTSSLPMEINIPSSSRHLIIITAATTGAKNAVLEVISPGDGSVIYHEVFKTNDLSLAKSTNKLTVSTTSSSTASPMVFDICLTGSVIS